MQLVAHGAPHGVQTLQAAHGERSLAAVRRIGSYPIYLGAAISYRTLEREWIDKVAVILGFAVAAMVALGAVSWKALRAAHDELMSSLCELLTHSLRENIRLHCHVAPGTWPIPADRGELDLALINIAVNARDAMPGGGTLTITARNATADDLLRLGGEMSGEFVLIALHDTGDGVPAEVLGRVFEPFFTTKAPGRGTGLGLSQVYGFTRQSGGAVTLQSPPGRGTTVTLWLPRSTEALAGRTTTPGTPAGMAQGTLLVVDDDTAVAAVLREPLEQLGYAARIATSGAEALEHLASGVRFDLVLTDVVMVGKSNGLELARLVRARHPDLPLIVMTGYAAQIARISEEGFTVLTKPFDVQTLASAIDAKLANEAVPGA